jgi:hypothetical protein
MYSLNKVTSVAHASSWYVPFISYSYRLSYGAGSSVNVVSDYGLDDRVIEVRPPAGAEDFSSSLCVQTGSGTHPASS